MHGVAHSCSGPTFDAALTIQSETNESKAAKRNILAKWPTIGSADLTSTFSFGMAGPLLSAAIKLMATILGGSQSVCFFLAAAGGGQKRLIERIVTGRVSALDARPETHVKRFLLPLVTV